MSIGNISRPAFVRHNDLIAHEIRANCASIGTYTGGVFASGGADGSVSIWKTGKPVGIVGFQDNKRPVTSIKLGPFERHLAIGTSNGHLKVYQLSNQRIKCSIPSAHKSSITCLQWYTSPMMKASTDSEQFLASGGDDGRICITNISNNEITNILTYSHPGPVGSITCLQFTPTGLWIGVGDSLGRLMIFDCQSSKLLYSYDPLVDQSSNIGHTGAVTSIDFHPTELLMASGGVDRSVKFWHFNTHDNSLSCVATSIPDSHPLNLVKFVANQSHTSMECLSVSPKTLVSLSNRHLTIHSVPGLWKDGDMGTCVLDCVSSKGLQGSCDALIRKNLFSGSPNQGMKSQVPSLNSQVHPNVDIYLPSRERGVSVGGNSSRSRIASSITAAIRSSQATSQLIGSTTPSAGNVSKRLLDADALYILVPCVHEKSVSVVGLDLNQLRPFNGDTTPFHFPGATPSLANDSKTTVGRSVHVSHEETTKEGRAALKEVLVGSRDGGPEVISKHSSSSNSVSSPDSSGSDLRDSYSLDIEIEDMDVSEGSSDAERKTAETDDEHNIECKEESETLLTAVNTSMGSVDSDTMLRPNDWARLPIDASGGSKLFQSPSRGSQTKISEKSQLFQGENSSTLADFGSPLPVQPPLPRDLEASHLTQGSPRFSDEVELVVEMDSAVLPSGRLNFDLAAEQSTKEQEENELESLHSTFRRSDGKENVFDVSSLVRQSAPAAVLPPSPSPASDRAVVSLPSVRAHLPVHPPLHAGSKKPTVSDLLAAMKPDAVVTSSPPPPISPLAAAGADLPLPEALVVETTAALEPNALDRTLGIGMDEIERALELGLSRVQAPTELTPPVYDLQQDHSPLTAPLSAEGDISLPEIDLAVASTESVVKDTKITIFGKHDPRNDLRSAPAFIPSTRTSPLGLNFADFLPEGSASLAMSFSGATFPRVGHIVKTSAKTNARVHESNSASSSNSSAVGRRERQVLELVSRRATATSLSSHLRLISAAASTWTSDPVAAAHCLDVLARESVDPVPLLAVATQIVGLSLTPVVGSSSAQLSVSGTLFPEKPTKFLSLGLNVGAATALVAALLKATSLAHKNEVIYYTALGITCSNVLAAFTQHLALTRNAHFPKIRVKPSNPRQLSQSSILSVDTRIPSAVVDKMQLDPNIEDRILRCAALLDVLETAKARSLEFAERFSGPDSEGKYDSNELGKASQSFWNARAALVKEISA